MRNEFIRNSVLFSVILLVCMGALGYFLVSENKKLAKIDDRVDRTHAVINEAHALSNLIEIMLSSQRGYIITKNPDFLEHYKENKINLSENLAQLTNLVSDNPAQISRLSEIRNLSNSFATQLEERAQKSANSVDALTDTELIDSLRDDMVRINNALIEEEYELLNERVQEVQHKKDQYYATLVIGGLTGTVILLIFNTFLMRSQNKRGKLETTLKDSEERFKLAVEGTQDGIFDWDIRTGEVFFSRQYWALLGEDREAFYGTYEDFAARLHPEDKDKVEEYVQLYLSDQLSEYSNVFRMRHESGRWLWINARAKTILDKHGKPVRMVGAHTDITASREYQEKLKEEKQQAQEANRAKSDFLAHMSHEIRTPLTTISGIASLLDGKRENLPEKLQPLTRTLVSSSSSLKDLITDILDFSKIESGEIELEDDAFELVILFEEVISMMAMRANEKGIEFKFTYDGLENVVFYGDKVRIRQILINLINNAVKFTENGHVHVAAVKKNLNGQDAIEIEFEDTGIGISEDNIDVIFERFKQADSSVSRKYGGTGLGLPISKNLAELMGGDIVVKSAIGKGSTFILTLPVREQAYHIEQREPDLKDKIDDKIRSTIKGEDKVLLVEDYEGNIVVLGHILEDLNITYNVAKTGLEAVNSWKDHHYALVLMDIQMPEMDGFTATKSIRKMEDEKGLQRTPIIGMTAHALVGDKDKCIESGMDAYLPKPIVENDLKELLFKYLNQYKEAA